MAKKKESKGLEKIKLDFSKLLLGSIIVNVLFLLYGVVTYLNPLIDLTVMRVMLGVCFIILGAYAIFEFTQKDKNPLFNLNIVWGILAILTGLLAIINPFNINKIFTFSLGIYLVIIALSRILDAIKLKKIGYDGWSLIITIGIILLIFGVFIMINPARMEDVETASIFVILASILEICNYILLYTKKEDILKLLNPKKGK